MLASQSSGASHERIGRYEVLRKIATGGMAELFLAKQVGMEGFERVVAIKRILAHLAYDEEFINMFRDEARIVAKLNHPNIVQIYDLGKSEDTYFIAMEYIPGRNLSSVAKKARARNESLPPSHIARCVAQACEGLHYAHTRSDMNGLPLQIVHRDVSPQNIIVSFSGTVKLVDFGIAKAATKIAHTRAGVLKGKYAYMSPEQIRGEDVDARSDLFAAGIVLYELLCGRRPFEKENSIQTLKAIVQENHRDCRELNAEIPDALAEIIDRALEKDRKIRFQSAQELQIALEDFVSAGSVRVNNITVSNWISTLFEEELSREVGGTVVFQGIGEVILPDVLDNEPKSEEISAPSIPSIEVPVEPAEQSVATGSAESGDGLQQPLPLTRGRGGGSIDVRPPIPAPSTALANTKGGGPARESLIEEGVIDRPLARRSGGFDDDATVLGTDIGAPSRDSTEIPQAPAKTPYDDSKTEFAPPHVPEAQEEESDEVRESPTVALRHAASSEDHTQVPDSTPALARPPSPSAPLPRAESAADLLQPLSQVAEDDFDGSDDPWDEATVGFPDGVPPMDMDSDPGFEVEASPEPSPDLSSTGDDWGELSADFGGDATLAGPPEGWDDETASNVAFSDPDDIAEPVVQEPLDYSDAEPLEIDLDDADPADVLGDATVTHPGLGDEVFGPDATIAVPSISDEMIERHATSTGRNLQRRSLEHRAASEAEIELSAADVEPLDFEDLTGDQMVPPPAASEEWAADATLAGVPAMPDVAGLDPDDEFEVDPGAPEEDVPGFEFEVGETVGGMDEEPELPMPKSDRDIDLDARTVAGTTSDYLVAGVRPPQGAVYDAEITSNRPPEVEAEYHAPSSPGRRGQEHLAAIKLSRVPVERDFGPEEVTEGEVEAFANPPESELPGVFEHLPVSVTPDEDAPLVHPSPLSAPPDEPMLPPPSMASRGSSTPSSVSAKDEYSALLAPQLPTPLNPSNQGDPGGPMQIGSTNVPPANLSLSQMLSHPSRTSRSKLMAIPRGASQTLEPVGRSASAIGRQIREVVRNDAPPSGEAPAPAPGSAPPMSPAGHFPAAPQVPVGELMAPAPSTARPSGQRRLLIASLIIVVIVLLAGVAFLSYPLLFAPSEPHLTIKTSPAGAEVYVDNARQRGTTPLTISGLEPGVTYTIRLVKDGFEPVSQTVRLPENRPLIWRTPLKPAAPKPAAGDPRGP